MQNTSAVEVGSSEKGEDRGKSPEFSEASTYWFPVYEGLFEHASTMRDAVWFFLWLIARTTRECSGEGRVLGGIQIDDGRPAGELGVSVKVIRRWRRILLKSGYISVVRTGYGFVYTLLKSKKYQYRDRPNRPISKPNQTGTQDREVPDRADQIGRSGQFRSAGAGSCNRTIQGQHKEDGRGGGAPETGATPTTTNQSSPVLKEPWEILGLTMPIGSVGFQGEWEAFYYQHIDEHVHLVDLMEEFIQSKQTRGQKIPPKFYDVKHQQERLHKEMIEEIDEAQRWAEANQRFEEELQERLALKASSSQVILMAPLPAETPALPERAEMSREEKERQVLRMVLRDSGVLETDGRIKNLDPNDFQYERNGLIFAAMRRMWRDGMAITVEYLAAWLQDHGELERAGGEGYVRALVDVDVAPARKAAAS